jgi:hypothetical protein
MTPPAMLRKDGGTDLRWVRKSEQTGSAALNSPARLQPLSRLLLGGLC